MKQVRETKAGKSISAWIVTKNDKEVAKIQAHYSDSGVVQVDCWAYPEWELVQSKAGGYGYDRLAAAMDGMYIDGIRLHDHARNDETIISILERYKAGKLNEQDFRRELAEHGAHASNWADGQWQSVHYNSGLDRLKDMGYKVYQAI